MTRQHVIHDAPHGWKVWHVAETGSTNDDLLADLEAGRAGHMTALATDHQTAGRGRLDRRWSAPSGANLLVSLAFTEVPDVPARLTHLVGLAAVDAVERLTAADGRGAADASAPAATVGLKWPNDVLLDGRKLAGILAQRSPSSGAVVVGLGLNVGWAPEGAASLAGDLGLDVRPLEVLAEVLAGIDRRRPSDAELHQRYRERLLTLDERVRVELPDESVVTGVAVDVEPDGRLVVATDEPPGQVQRLDVGDVVHLRTV